MPERRDFGSGMCLFAAEIAGSERTAVVEKLLPWSGADYLAAFLTGLRSEFHDVVRRFDHVAIVFDDDDRVACCG